MAWKKSYSANGLGACACGAASASAGVSIEINDEGVPTVEVEGTEYVLMTQETLNQCFADLTTALEAQKSGE